MMEYNQIIAERINRLCEENHMTIGQLADACKMNRATIENIMSGKCRKPRIQTLYSAVRRLVLALVLLHIYFFF